MQKTILITGASRGIGLEMSRQFTASGDRVIAICRSSNSELIEITQEVLTGIDFQDDGSFQRVSEFIGDTSIDILINNAGVYYIEGFEDINFDHVREQLFVNSTAPVKLTCTLLKNLHFGSKVAMMSSILGSITKNRGLAHYGYQMSKSALNMASKSLSHDLRSKGIAIGIFHPGRVNTRMTNFDGDYTPEESASKIISQIQKLDMSSTGKYVDLEGNELPW